MGARRVVTFTVLLLAVVWIGGSTLPGTTSAQGGQDRHVYLPFVTRSDACDLNAYEARILEMMRTDSRQQRPALNCDSILERVARERALDMAVRGYFGHVNPDGYGPNYLVRQAGYPLPAWYDPSVTGNNIESIGAGYSTPDAVWAGWMASSAHRDHLLGLDPFWAAQIEYGIGYVYDANSPYDHYWVVLTAYKEP